MKKMLPVTYPPVTSFPGYADALAIALNSKSGYNWFLHSFINVFMQFDSSSDTAFVDFVNLDFIRFDHIYHLEPQNLFCPPIKAFSIPVNMLNLFDSFFDFVKYLIDKDFYVLAFVNYGVLRRRDSQITHETFVYGYDEERKMFNIADFQLNNSGYKFTEISSEHLEKAFYSVKEKTGVNTGAFFDQRTTDQVIALTPNDDIEVEFCPQLFVSKIEQYLNKQKLYVNYRPLHVYLKSNDDVEDYWGISFYEGLKRLLLCRMKKGNWVDYRQFHLLYDQKNSILVKLKFLINLYNISEAYQYEWQKIVDQTFLVRNMIIKYNIREKEDSDMAYKICNILDILRNKEQGLLEDLIKSILEKA